ncbi:ER membrane organization protein, HVA22/TB2/DP1 family protein [Schizosaccharomyces osmophilus]|uniref:Protein YOP1 n=1 Tax=Schizosaccharomyces osmophilus TaxID=2545709 RepID=A0AAE9W6Z6_9SCHI|nr:ER membrane organization protein, HVA22/TB2/DP1 family protein [Schizosaccharomyces osmophilus]WBW70630.1 ER membrane organization protein, HVA22/TB2/DP1 family protein [Schizosaccharomyces osmophilus]
MEILSTVIGAGYPIYRSYLLLEVPAKANQLIPKAFQIRNNEPKTVDEERRRLMAYWCVYGCVTSIEGLVGSYIRWVPFYSTAKVVLWIWLLHPKTRGSEYVYQTYISTFLREHKDTIQGFLEKLVQLSNSEQLLINSWGFLRSMIDYFPKGDTAAPGSKNDAPKKSS